MNSQDEAVDLREQLVAAIALLKLVHEKLEATKWSPEGSMSESGDAVKPLRRERELLRSEQQYCCGFVFRSGSAVQNWAGKHRILQHHISKGVVASTKGALAGGSPSRWSSPDHRCVANAKGDSKPFDLAAVIRVSAQTLADQWRQFRALPSHGLEHGQNSTRESHAPLAEAPRERSTRRHRTDRCDATGVAQQEERTIEVSASHQI
jgi:hypothetical protein